MAEVNHFLPPLTLEANLAALETIWPYLDEAARQAGLDAPTAYRLRLAVDELVTNVVVHGYAEAGLNGPLRLQASWDENCLTLLLEDTGQPYDPRQAPAPDLSLPLDRRTEGGLGIYLLLKNLDAFDYTRVGQTNRSYLTVNKTTALPKPMLDEVLLAPAPAPGDDPTDLAVIDGLNDRAWHLFNSEPAAALDLAQQALALSEGAAYERGLAQARLNQAAAYFVLSDNAQAIEAGEQALQAFVRLADRAGHLEVLGVLAAVYGTQNDYGAAVNYGLQALQLAEDLADQAALSKVLFNLGAVYSLMEQYATALTYQLRAAHLERDLGDDSHLAATFTSLSELYLKLDQTELALSYGVRALALAGASDNRYVQAHLKRHLGSLYHILGQDDESLANFETSLAIFESLGNRVGLAETLLQLGNFYSDTAHLEAARQSYERSRQICEELGVRDLLYGVHAAYARFYEAQADFGLALHHHKLYHEIKNEVLSSENQLMITTMQLRFESERAAKEREIYRLRNIELVAANEQIASLNEQLRAEVRSVKRELEIGRQIQSSFLPEALPDLPGWEISSFFKPAREVSGDFYDAFSLPNARLGFVIADVCDKGVGAALFMALTRSLVRVLAQQASLRLSYQTNARARVLVELDNLVLPADIFEVLNSVGLANNYIVANHSESNIFATLFFGVLDTRTGSVYYVNGGHDAPIHLGPGGVKARLPRTGPAVGAIEDVHYKIGRVQLEPGEILLAYTDGITEARDASGTLFGEPRFLALLEGGLPDPATGLNALLNSVSQAVEAHVAQADPSDDITLLALRRL